MQKAPEGRFLSFMARRKQSFQNGDRVRVLNAPFSRSKAKPSGNRSFYHFSFVAMLSIFKAFRKLDANSKVFFSALPILLIGDNYFFYCEKFIALCQISNIKPAWKIAAIEGKCLSVDVFYFYYGLAHGVNHFKSSVI